MDPKRQRKVLFPMKSVRQKLKKVRWTADRKSSMKSLKLGGGPVPLGGGARAARTHVGVMGLA